MLWYPVKDQRHVDTCLRQLSVNSIKRVLRLEWQIADPVPGGPLAASGLLIVNPPFQLLDEARAILPFLIVAMADKRGSKPRIEWLAGE
jgi:23S rRNA (adenine2030-N6)-methyltransferase